MNPIYILLGIFAPIIMFFLSGVAIYRSENCIREFSFPLEQKFPRSYFEQNAVIRFIRKLCRMDTDDRVHWLHCVFHYVQIASVILPVLVSLVLIFFLPIEMVGIIYLIISCVPPFIVYVVDHYIFLIIQSIRCKKIKKTNPKYSKSEFRDWRG